VTVFCYTDSRFNLIISNNVKYLVRLIVKLLLSIHLHEKYVYIIQKFFNAGNITI
jgi:hypothetical protein